MSRRRADSQGSLGPDDEVVPYSDDETDDELDPNEGMSPAAPGPGPEAQSTGESAGRWAGEALHAVIEDIQPPNPEELERSGFNRASSLLCFLFQNRAGRSKPMTQNSVIGLSSNELTFCALRRASTP